MKNGMSISFIVQEAGFLGFSFVVVEILKEWMVGV